MNITLNFQGHSTLQEAYQLYIKSFKTALILICGTGTYKEKLEKRREVLELLSILDNAMFAQQYPTLARKTIDNEKLNHRKNIETTSWTLNHNGKRIEKEDSK